MLIKIINPQKISLQTVHNEIAKVAKTNVQNIIKVEYWAHQIWVNISGVGGRILSYRSLPAWLQEIIITIRDCTSLEQLQQLGNILKVETRKFSQYYTEEYKQKLREIWSEQRDYLQQEEERTKATREHEQKAQEWLEIWRKMITNWQSVDSLQYLYQEMEKQSKEYADLPKIVEELLQTFQSRYKEFSYQG